MFQSVLLPALLLLCVHGEQFNPKKDDWDYCKESCKTKDGVFPASGCDCMQRGTRTEIDLDQFLEFRKVIVNEHNYYRNQLASGNETRGFAQPAADMLVVNYDLELEYLARCLGRGLFQHAHDKCRKLQNGQQAGQNFGATSELPIKGFGQAKERISKWYGEVVSMQPDIYERFRKGVVPIGHFTAMCWATVDSVGCARIYVKDPKKEKFTGDFSGLVTYLICNYAGKKLKTGVNVLDSQMYTPGQSCSQCPNIEKLNSCNRKFTSLCGELEPIPTEKPYDFGNAPHKVCGKISILVLTFAVLMVL